MTICAERSADSQLLGCECLVWSRGGRCWWSWQDGLCNNKSKDAFMLSFIVYSWRWESETVQSPFSICSRVLIVSYDIHQLIDSAKYWWNKDVYILKLDKKPEEECLYLKSLKCSERKWKFEFRDNWQTDWSVSRYFGRIRSFASDLTTIWKCSDIKLCHFYIIFCFWIQHRTRQFSDGWVVLNLTAVQQSHPRL